MRELASQAEFLNNGQGGISITLSDPAFVQSETIVVERKTLSVFAVFHEAAYFLGPISQEVADVLARHNHVMLSSLRGDGTMFELKAPISVH